MRKATSDDFLANRYGAYVLGSRHMVWCSDPTLGGVVVWGAFEEVDVQALTPLLDFDLVDGRDPHYDIVVDASRLISLGRAAFERLAAFVGSRIGARVEMVRRHAIVVPDGLVGALLAGLLPILGHDPSSLFTSAEQAFESMARPEVLPEIRHILDAAIHTSPLVRDLRNHLAAQLAQPSIDHAARALGRSARSLQRDLKSAGTSFRDEVERARVEAAKVLLTDSDDKLHSIALRVGFASPGAFSRRFRSRIGQTPTEYRSRHR